MTKKWTIKSAEGTKFDFYPIFRVRNEENDVECKDIKIKIGEKEHTFDFINLYQFIYWCASEELRRGLQMRYERRINNIPYDVSFKLSDDEARDKFAKRRISLPIDELSMAIARNEAFKLWPVIKNKLLGGVKPFELFKGRK